ncbi:glycyl radical protein [Pelomyxa schiedti]|nr:glycyl radical protein [Pelomyxa schiedti]
MQPVDQINGMLGNPSSEEVARVPSRGGVTITGGEPLLQSQFVLHLVRELKAQGIHVAMESNASLIARSVTAREVVKSLDYCIVDLKCAHECKHEEVTGVALADVREGVAVAASECRDVLVRTPVIPGVNNTSEDIESLANLVASLPSRVSWELLPYHNRAKGKYSSLGIPYLLGNLSPLSQKDLAPLSAIAQYIAPPPDFAPSLPSPPQQICITGEQTHRSARTDTMLRELLNLRPSVSHHRAQVLTEFFQDLEHQSIPTPISYPPISPTNPTTINASKSPALAVALAFKKLCEEIPVGIHSNDLLVGERGKGGAPKVVPTYPELHAHTAAELRELISRSVQKFDVSEDCAALFDQQIHPSWHGKTVTENLIFANQSEYKNYLTCGGFTQFIDFFQPYTVNMDDRLYRFGLGGVISEIQKQILHLQSNKTSAERPDCTEEFYSLSAMLISCTALISLAHRYASCALQLASQCEQPERRNELQQIAHVCNRVPENPPSTLWEAIQFYWFLHMGTTLESNSDALGPGFIDRYLAPFYFSDVYEKKTITHQFARELLEGLVLKLYAHYTTPTTLGENATYVYFSNLQLGGDNPNELSAIFLDILDDLHLFQPLSQVFISQKTPDWFLHRACRAIRHGTGYPAVFNLDSIRSQLRNHGCSSEDAMSNGGVVGCVETICVGKECLFTVGYLNATKPLELALNNGVDPLTGQSVGPATGDPTKFTSLQDVLDAYVAQFRNMVRVKVAGDFDIETQAARRWPTPFRSVIIDGCVENHALLEFGGAKYNSSAIAVSCFGSTVDSLVALDQVVFSKKLLPMSAVLEALRSDFAGCDNSVHTLLSSQPKWGNDCDTADNIAIQLERLLRGEIDGRKNFRGGVYRAEFLSVTAHISFGSSTGATPNGRKARTPLSEGLSASQGQDKNSPTALLLSASKLDHTVSKGNLLNVKFLPDLLAGARGELALAALLRGYFSLGGHELQCNVVSGHTLRDAQLNPDKYRDLIVRVAGYSDLFVELTKDIQDDIIARTEHGSE